MLTIPRHLRISAEMEKVRIFKGASKSALKAPSRSEALTSCLKTNILAATHTLLEWLIQRTNYKTLSDGANTTCLYFLSLSNSAATLYRPTSRGLITSCLYRYVF